MAIVGSMSREHVKVAASSRNRALISCGLVNKSDKRHREESIIFVCLNNYLLCISARCKSPYYLLCGHDRYSETVPQMDLGRSHHHSDPVNKSTPSQGLFGQSLLPHSVSHP
jgi:hypothetical protein